VSETRIINGVVRYEADDASRVVRTYDEHGVLITSVAYTQEQNAAADAEAQRQAAIRQALDIATRAGSAMAANRDYIALTDPVGATQAIAQVKALTWQMQYVIALLTNRLDQV